jgi:hypothetical protein
MAEPQDILEAVGRIAAARPSSPRSGLKRKGK